MVKIEFVNGFMLVQKDICVLPGAQALASDFF